MPESPQRIAILGATGSIGGSALEVVAASQGRLQVAGLTAHSRLTFLLEQAQRFRPAWIIGTDETVAQSFDWTGAPPACVVKRGMDAVIEAVASPDVDVVLAAMVGSAGLHATWAALAAGKTVALANKETLVMAGGLVTALARRTGATIVPVDSEHSAVWQALQAGRRAEVRRIVLTASGGPFLRHSCEQLSNVTVEEALAHPTWTMGRKITVDSATMMNKALEIIEARWLFDLDVDQIGVVIHPQSLIHGLVEFVDGSIVAQMSCPDMRLPIQYALNYPERREQVSTPFDWSRATSLTLEPPDEERFPALRLGREAARVGGTAGAVLNAANEAAVAGFLEGELRFNEIVPACERVLGHHDFDPNPTLDDLIRLDRWAREEVVRWACA
ncbi:MAG: 1-deoxy-D-xylulose-5-phosphate reductoisomerase [Planctomycetia bacterium]|nr:1-deoxy-D-xylulose-5-phosphate reductoisomerase [Planctomycetia bacterium]